MSYHLKSLNTAWQLKERQLAHSLEQDFASTEGWLPTQVPGSVQQTLLEQGLIPDPFYGMNELEVQWVGQRIWLYQTEFSLEAAELGTLQAELVFEGLDTYATVWLNGVQILSSHNMFVGQRVAVKPHLKVGQNVLSICFENALEQGQQLEREYGQQPLWNGESSRLHVRKAQYHYGWDWGPVLMTVGIWRPVQLELFDVRICELYCPVTVSQDLKTASFPITVSLTGHVSEDLKLRLRLLSPLGECSAEIVLAAELILEYPFSVQNPQLWFARGQGGQPLYTLEVTLERGGVVLQKLEQRLGVRRLRLVQEPLEGEDGTNFTFELNGIPLFAGGANWIPDDSLLGRISPERYRQRLTQAAQGNMNMVRVWGGGIYEEDVFYDLCDELGLLVWQDFMFACGMYPAYPEFLESVRLEAEYNVKRLRHHPSIALWCGNNEDYAVAESLNLYGLDKDQSLFPGLEIYERLLPEICAKLDAGRSYWPGSPYAGKNSADPTMGDRHSWEVWHGNMDTYQNYHRYQARFISEFGLMSAPGLKLLEQVLPLEERFPESRTMTHHIKAGSLTMPDGYRRMAVYYADTLRAHQNLADYVYGTQLVQAEAMRYAYSDFRRRFQGAGKHYVSGALVWQLNDCWPVSSWAIIDSSGTPKPAYFAIKRELAPDALALRNVSGTLEGWIFNAHLERQTYRLDRFAYTLHGELLAKNSLELEALPNQSTELPTLEQPHGDQVVWFGELYQGAEIVARASVFPEPYKYFSFLTANLQVRVQGDTVRLRATALIKGLWLETDSHVVWDDNHIDLMPGEERTLVAQGLKGQAVRARHLGGSLEDRVQSHTLLPT